MPQTRRTAGRKNFLINAAEARRFSDVCDVLKTVSVLRDKDDLLTAGFGKLADDLQAAADAMSKPLAKRPKKEQAVGGATPLLDDLKNGDGAANGSGASDEPKKVKTPKASKEPAAS